MPRLLCGPARCEKVKLSGLTRFQSILVASTGLPLRLTYSLCVFKMEKLLRCKAGQMFSFTTVSGAFQSGLNTIVFMSALNTGVRFVEVETEEGGWSAQVYVADAAGESLSAWGSPRATVDDAEATHRFELGEPPPAGAAVLVWFTRLPESGRVTVSEVRVG